MAGRIVVLDEEDLKDLLQQAAAAALQGLALTLSGGAAAAAAAATRKLPSSKAEAWPVGQQSLALALPALPAKEKKKRPDYNSTGRQVLPMDAPGEWMSPSEAARFLGMSDASVYFGINAGRFPVKYAKEGGSLIVRKDEVKAYKRDNADKIKRRKAASKAGVSRGGQPRRVEASPGWLNLQATQTVLGLGAGGVKARRVSGEIKARRMPGRGTGSKVPWEYEEASVHASAAKRAKA